MAINAKFCKNFATTTGIIILVGSTFLPVIFSNLGRQALLFSLTPLGIMLCDSPRVSCLHILTTLWAAPLLTICSAIVCCFLLVSDKARASILTAAGICLFSWIYTMPLWHGQLLN
jgi:hypothetical protein